MNYKKSIIMLILTIFVLFSIAGVCAGEVDETAMAVADTDGIGISDDNQVIGPMDNLADDSANIGDSLNEQNDDISDGGKYQVGRANDDVLSLSEENSSKVGNVISVSGSTFKSISNAIRSASDGDIISLSEITYKNDDEDEIAVNKQITIDGHGATLDGGEDSRIFYVTAKNVVIHNLCFKKGYRLEGGAIYLSGDTSNCTVIDCEFTDNHGTRGCAIYDVGSSNKIFNCNIHDNRGEYGAIHSRGFNVTVTDCVFTNNEGTTGGGGVFLAGSYATIANCMFTKNHAKSYGGGLQFNYNSVNCTVVNSIFDSNYAADAGAVSGSGSGNVVLNCDFNDNYASSVSDGGGGAIWWDVVGGEISCCNFKDNAAKYGGAIYNENGDVTISDSAFDCNTAKWAGAIYNENGDVTVMYSSFECNSAENGGVIFNGGTLTVLSSLMDSNSASYGGAIYNDGKLEVIDSLFSNNYANLGEGDDLNSEWVDLTSNCGGAILNNGDLTLSKSVFEGNNASSLGGAVLNNATLYVTGCMFKDNSAWYGGAISNLYWADVGDSNFTDNFATVGGAAIYTSGVEWGVHGSIFEGNTAKYGGAIFNAYGSLSLADSTFTSNYAVGGGAVNNYAIFDGVNNIFVNNSANDGGAILNSGTSYVLESTFIGNNATRHGGAIYSEEASLTVRDSTLTGNSARNGGAIHNNRGEFTISNTILANNAAVLGGGAIVTVGDYDVTGQNLTPGMPGTKIGWAEMENITVFNNTVVQWGAGIYSKDCDLTISGSTLSANHNATIGGAIYNENGTITISNSEFTDNMAMYGGGIYNENCDMTLYASTLANNNAQGGGAIANLYSLLKISESSFIENNARQGSAIFADDGDSINIFGHTLFLDNFDNTHSVDVDKGSVNISNCEFLYSISFEIGHINDAYLGSSIVIDVVAKMRDDHLGSGDVIVDVGGEKYTVQIINGTGRQSVTPSVGAGKYKATLSFNELGYIAASAESNEFALFSRNSFTALNNLIKNADKSLNLDTDYVFDPASDSEFKDGIVINKDLTITGNGKTIDAGGNARIFSIAKDSKVQINNLNFKNADSSGDGGAISNNGDLTIAGAVLTNNTADKGGAIYNGGKLTITDSVLTNNRANDGGAIRNTNELDIVESTIGENTAAGSGGAIDNDGNLTITGAVLTNNRANDGGAIRNTKELRIVKSTIGDNNAVGIGGAIYNDDKVTIDESTLTNNNATEGSAVWTKDGENVEITNSQFVDNANNDESISSENGGVDISESKFLTSVSFKIGNIGNFTNGQSIEITVTETSKGKEFNGNVVVSIGGEKYPIEIVNGSGAKTVTPNIDPGRHTAKLTFDVTNEYGSATAESNVFTVSTVEGIVSVGASDDVYVAGKVSKFRAVFNDKLGNPLVNTSVEIVVDGEKIKAVTDERGVALFDISKSEGKYNVTITNPVTGEMLVRTITVNKPVETTPTDNPVVKKVAPKLTAKNKSFKAKTKTKKYTITLKDNAGSPIKKAKVTLKIKGKTYKATTNAKGKATFNIKKLTKKGKYTASVTFAGSAKFSALTKKVKITVKK